MPRGPGKIQKKILVLLYGGLALMFSGSPLQHAKIWRAVGKEWEKIDREALYQAIRGLYRSKLVDFKERSGGAVEMVISESGKKKVLEYNLDELRIRTPKRWDGRWRMVCFDIPKEKKKVREAFRFHLRRLGFHQFQKSVFVHPYPCEGEIDFLIEIYNARPYVRQIVAVDIDNALHLRKIFHQ